jgi:HSP20 family protein
MPRLFDFDPQWPKWVTEVVGPDGGFAGMEGKFLPEANMTETDKGVEVTMELPGMTPEQVKVEFHDGALWVTGEKKEEKEEKGKTFHRVERRTGQFRRVFAMPTVVDEGKIAAKFDGGVLTITLPKTEQAVPRKIEIK